jgi:acyl dehydratase
MGGFGYQSKNQYPPPAKIPTRKPDTILEAKTYPNQAFFFRLTGDRNPLHIDTKSAKKLDFKQPIIHGTYLTLIQVWLLMGLSAEYFLSRSSEMSIRE